jgi:hypothetical protein
MDDDIELSEPEEEEGEDSEDEYNDMQSFDDDEEDGGEDEDEIDFALLARPGAMEAFNSLRTGPFTSMLPGAREGRHGTRSSHEVATPAPLQPSEKGQQLMGSSDFGAVGFCPFCR